MPVFRTPDGKIVEEKTKQAEEPAQNGDETEKVDPPDPGGVGNTPSDDFYDAPTKVSKDSEDSKPGQQAVDDDEVTRVYRRSSAETSEQKRKEALPSDAMQDPVVGWLVVIDGPGCGEVLSLGYGMNSIGRSDEDRVSLSFGDNEISRTRHAVLTYDPKKRLFYMQQGEGRNLAYIDDEPVLQPTPIESGCNIEIGRTLLKFVAFCGPHFDWQDQQGEA